MAKGKAGEPPGVWLKKAIKAQGATIKGTNRTLGYSSPSKYDEHSQNTGQLSFESLQEIAKLYPTMNMHFVLTGEGNPLLH